MLFWREGKRFPAIFGLYSRTLRSFSVQVNSSGQEWKAAKPYSAIPTQSFLSFDFLPGGKLYKVPFVDLQTYLYEKNGPIVRVPGIFGKNDTIWLFDPIDFEKVFRTEGQWPFRLELDSLSYCSVKTRPDIYGDITGGLAFV